MSAAPHDARPCFPLALAADVSARQVDERTARRAIHTLWADVFPARTGFAPPQVPEERRPHGALLRQQHAALHHEWVVFYRADAPVGWSTGGQSDELTFAMRSSGVVTTLRRQGVYRAFLRGFLPYLAALGYERVTSQHHPNNRAVLIAKLHAGFTISGFQIDERAGPLVLLTYMLHPDRQRAYEQMFHLAAQPPSSLPAPYAPPPTDD